LTCVTAFRASRAEQLEVSMLTTLRTALIAATLTTAISSAFAQTDDKKLGAVHFETTCTSDAQKLFDRAMLYQHSFWYRASQKTFEDVLKADPGCGIAYWGIALSLLWNPHIAPPAKNLDLGEAKANGWGRRVSASATIWTRSG
jgi:hypothetical protein